LPFQKNILAQFLIINKCSLHEVLFERKAEITLIIPDLDNASEGRGNTRLRVTPELFYNRTYKTEYDEIRSLFVHRYQVTLKQKSWQAGLS